jgi:hypothetical protein
MCEWKGRSSRGTTHPSTVQLKHTNMSNCDPAFFLVQHDFINDEVKDKLWESQDSSSAVLEWKTKSEQFLEKGFHSHSFMPSSRDGPLFCLWEAKPRTTDQELKDFLDTFAFPGYFNNKVHRIDNSLATGIHTSMHDSVFGGKQNPRNSQSQNSQNSQNVACENGSQTDKVSAATTAPIPNFYPH